MEWASVNERDVRTMEKQSTSTHRFNTAFVKHLCIPEVPSTLLGMSGGLSVRDQSTEP
jgi:hypothetical protein